MTIESDALAALQADSTLVTAMTGGVYAYNGIGRQGLTRSTFPAAYDATTGLLKPTCIIKMRRQRPDNQIADEVANLVSFIQIMEVWVFVDGAQDLTTLETARARIYAALQFERLSGVKVLWDGTFTNERDYDQDNALWYRMDFRCHGILS